jgi:hypothetical protein
MKKKYLPILTLIVVLMAANLACSISTASLGAPTAEPTRVIPVSTQAALGFQQSFEQPTVDAQAGTVTIQFNEEQITSYVTYQLAQDPTVPIHNPQIYLENNQVVVRGQIVTDAMTSDGQITATVTVDAGGKLKVDIVSAEVGSLQIPPQLLGAVTDMLDNAIKDNINTDNYVIQSITIANHLMTIVLKVNK